MGSEEFFKEVEELINKHDGLSVIKEQYGITNLQIMKAMRNGVCNLVIKNMLESKEKQNG